jgi:hypothetical protein
MGLGELGEGGADPVAGLQPERLDDRELDGTAGVDGREAAPKGGEGRVQVIVRLVEAEDGPQLRSRPAGRTGVGNGKSERDAQGREDQIAAGLALMLIEVEAKGGIGHNELTDNGALKLC